MISTILTKSESWFGPIAYLLGLIMNALYEFFNLFGIQNIALTIIVFTFLVKTLMLPLTIKQQKFSKLSSKMNPELQKIQAKYKGKKDEASLKKQQAETQVIYQKYGSNPTSGCLPLLITLPIMFALYAVINNIPAYVDHVRQLYESIAIQVQTVTGWEGMLKTLADTINAAGMPKEYKNATDIIDVMKHFNSDTWAAFATSFSDIQKTVVSGESTTVANTIANIKNVNSFLGLNIANAPGFKLTPALLVPILAGSLQYIQGKQIQVKTKDMQDNPAAAAMNSMNVVMPLMSAFFCITFPIGVGIYWIATSVYTIIQQFFVNKYMDRIDVDDLIAKNVAKQSKRNAYLESKGISMSELAKKQTKYIESTATEKGKSADVSEKQGNEEEEVVVEENSKKSQPSTSGKSISEIANLLKNKNEKGDK